MFAHSAAATAEAVGRPAACGLPRWAKLSPNVADLIRDRRRPPSAAGAEALTLVNTLLGHGDRPRAPAAGARGGRRRAVGSGGPPGGGAGRLRVPGGLPRRRHRRRGRRLAGERRRRAAAGRGRRRPGGHGHLPSIPQAPWRILRGASSVGVGRHGWPAVRRADRSGPWVASATGWSTRWHRTGPLCAGIDPSAALLAAWGLPDDAEGLRAFGGAAWRRSPAWCRWSSRRWRSSSATARPASPRWRSCSPGPATLGCWSSPTPSGATSAARPRRYAQAWLDRTSPLAADAVTATPYLGLGALRPLVDAARTSGRGVFVVVRSSNPEGRALQEADDRRRGLGRRRPAGRHRRAQRAELDRSQASPSGRSACGRGHAPAVAIRPGRRCGGDLSLPGSGRQGLTPADVAAAVRRLPAEARCCPTSPARSWRPGRRSASLRAAAIQAGTNWRPS